ncbi:MAG TPA: hypothetical protein VHU84_06910 [Lacipirellulaceae bacterium]|jgi:hypothetical protein|nr:hypothetical protein [Lacipirellulaceae bacterium]
MATDGPQSLGSLFAHRFADARQDIDRAPCPGARELPMLKGLNINGSANVPIENLYATATDILTKTNRVFVYCDSIALEIGTGDTLSLHNLTTGCELLPTGPALFGQPHVVPSRRDEYVLSPSASVRRDASGASADAA